MLQFLKDNMEYLARCVDEGLAEASEQLCERAVYKMHDYIGSDWGDEEMRRRVSDFLKEHADAGMDFGQTMYGAARKIAYGVIQDAMLDEFGNRLPDDDEVNAVLDEIYERSIVPKFRDFEWVIQDFLGISYLDFDVVLFKMGVYNS